jgi:Zn-dependent dipeptidase, microsomal dipeptidase homolog
MLKKFLLALLVILAVGLIVFFGFVPQYIDSSKNTVSAPPTTVSEAGYDQLSFIADLHCDMLLWDRDFFEEHDYGHVDLPRMQKANMAFQAFTIVSKTPRNMNIQSNDSNTDQIGLLSFAQLRPPSSWFSIKARALHQCKQLQEFADDSDGQFRIINNQKDLKQFISDRATNNKLTSGMLGLEGAHCLENELSSLDDFYKAGVRYIGLAHFFDNEWAGSAHGISKGGLTDIGRKLVMKMDSLKIIIDLAHSSVQTIDEVLSMTSSPVIVSHTGVKGVCENQRNLSDKHLLEIGKRNGLVGIGLWETAVCGTDAAATAKSIRYVADLIGVDKVALGSDFDGAIQAHFDVTGLPSIMGALKKEGFSTAEIDLIMGGNIRDFFLRNLPE